MKPCKTCPFRRDVEPGALGGSPATVFIGQVHGPFWLPCHTHTNYSDPKWKEDYSKPQCAGAAIYRANAIRYKLPDQLLQLPSDRVAVFDAPEQFLSHHLNISTQEAIDQLHQQGGVFHYTQLELVKAGVKIVTL